MCVIVVLKGDQTIKKEDFEKMYDRNSDGIGFAYRKSGKVDVFKGMLGLGKAWKAFSAIRNFAKDDIVVHFRKVSRGTKELVNCHPFSITDTCAMAHNGTFDIPLIYANRSDTWHFVRYIKHLGEMSAIGIEEWLKRESYLTALDKSIGFKNRVAFMTMDAVYTIGGQWSEHEGIKCSNLLWKYKDPVVNGCFASTVYSTVPKKLYKDKFENSEFEWGIQMATKTATYFRVQLLSGDWPDDKTLRALCHKRFNKNSVFHEDELRPFTTGCVRIISKNIREVDCLVKDNVIGFCC